MLRNRAATVAGISNGVDYDEWSPQAQTSRGSKIFSAGFIRQSQRQAGLLAASGLKMQFEAARARSGLSPASPRRRASTLSPRSLDSTAREAMIIVALGLGDKALRRALSSASNKLLPARSRGNRVTITSPQDRSGSGIFLMPSRLRALRPQSDFSLKYGPYPSCAAPGAPDDTISPGTPRRGKGIGFKVLRIRTASSIAADDQGSLERLQRSDVLAGADANGMKKGFFLE